MGVWGALPPSALEISIFCLVGYTTSPCFRRGRASGFVLRGGSWNNNIHNARAVNRNRNNPNNRNNNIGFRVVVVSVHTFPSLLGEGNKPSRPSRPP